MLDFILLLAMWMVGIFTFSFSFMQIVLSIFTSIPMVKKCRRDFGSEFNSSFAYKWICMTIIINIIIVSIPVSLLILFGNEYAKIGFLGGAGMSFLFSLGKWSWRHPANSQDFYTSIFLKCYRGESLDSQKSPNNSEQEVKIFTCPNCGKMIEPGEECNCSKTQKLPVPPKEEKKKGSLAAQAGVPEKYVMDENCVPHLGTINGRVVDVRIVYVSHRKKLFHTSKCVMGNKEMLISEAISKGYKQCPRCRADGEDPEWLKEYKRLHEKKKMCDRLNEKWSKQRFHS